MIAGAHLVGIGALKTYIESGGTTVPKDGNQVPITDYIRQFGNYQMPGSFLNHLELDNTISGGNGNDTLIGFGGDDTLIGKGGTDVLIGGSGADTFRGGAGNDTIWGNDLYDKSVETGGHDRVDYSLVGGQIGVGFNGDSEHAVIAVDDGEGGRDILYGIEEIIGSTHHDFFAFTGVVPDGYRLTVNAGGGGETYGEVINLLGASTHMHFANNNSGGVLFSDGSSGRIFLFGFHTDIVGSDYDDTITDEADGEKHVNGGSGDDTITIDGGDGLIRGGMGDDEINGGDGNDQLYGEDGTDIVHGGAGSDWLENQHFDDVAPGSAVVDADELHGDEGADYLHATASSADAILSGGAGNDVIDARGSHGAEVRFGAGDGHDMILSDREIGVEYEVGEEPRDGVGVIDMSTVSKSEVTILWNPTYLIEDVPPNGDPTDIPGYLYRQGDLVIRIDATGDTILVRNIRGTTTYWEDPAEASQPPFDGPFDFIDLHEINELVQFADGPISYEDYLGANPLVSLRFGSVAQYATALDEYQAATAADPGANDGTPGADDLRGSSSDDAIDGGDGDDSFHGSGGSDAIDGGAGSDTLYLFGARADFLISRDAATGDVTLEDKTHLEGKVTIKSVEKIYFATDNASFAPGDLVGFWGTGQDDALVEGNERDNLVYGLAGNDLLRGLAGNDRLEGGDGNDTLEGGAGNDVLDGGAGADAMTGGSGDDVYYLVDAGDSATESAAGGSDEIRTNAASYTLGANFERLTGFWRPARR